MKLPQPFQHNSKEDLQNSPPTGMPSIFLDNYTYSGSVAASAYSEPMAVEFPNQPQLPYELLLHIFSYILEHRGQLTRLCQCSKLFRSVAEVYLYRSLELHIAPESAYGKNQLKKQLDLLEMLQKPRYSTILKEMRVKLGWCAIGPPPKDCSCWKVDRMLGSALRSMEMLQVLSIKCHLCQDPSNPRHRYLMELPTRSMKEFCYDCYCTTERENKPTPFILAPWMASITALKWTSWMLTPTLERKFSAAASF